MHYQWLFKNKPLPGSEAPYEWADGELQACVQAAQAGDQMAINKLCANFEQLIMSVVYKIFSKYGSSWDELRNVVWEHFLDIIMHYEGTDEEFETLPQYIYLRLTSRSLREYYNNCRYSITQGEDIDSPENAAIPAPDKIEHYIQNQGLKHSLASLTDREREIIYKIYYDNKSTEAIGEELNLTGGRIRQLHIIALEKLHQQLEYYN